MSKSGLKKEIKDYPREALIELICSAYDSKLPANDFFDYYVDPAPAKAEEKIWKAIKKELNGTRRRRALFSISKVKKSLKLIEGYGLGDLAMARVMLMAVAEGGDVACVLRMSETQKGGLAKLYREALEMSVEKSLLFDLAAEIDRAVTPCHEYTINYDLLRELRSIKSELLGENVEAGE